MTNPTAEKNQLLKAKMIPVICQLRRRFSTNGIPFDLLGYYRISTAKVTIDNCQINFMESDVSRISLEYLNEEWNLQTVVLEINDMIEFWIWKLD